MRLIDADALIGAIRHDMYQTPDSNWGYGLNHAVAIVRSQPTVDVGNWTYIKDGLPEKYAGPLWVACRAKDGSRENWVACGSIYGYCNGTTNPWGIPLLDNDNYEAYAWMYEWYPKPPKEECE